MLIKPPQDTSFINFERFANAFRSGDKEEQYRFVKEVQKMFNALYSQIGKNFGPPPQAAFDVSGANGNFTIRITNPQAVNPQSPTQATVRQQQGTNTIGALMFHNLQSATNTNFDNAAGVTDWPVSPQTFFDIRQPNTTWFWRLRSTFDPSNPNGWNTWQVFGGSSGPTGVASGV